MSKPSMAQATRHSQARPSIGPPGSRCITSPHLRLHHTTKLLQYNRRTVPRKRYNTSNTTTRRPLLNTFPTTSSHLNQIQLQIIQQRSANHLFKRTPNTQVNTTWDNRHPRFISFQLFHRRAPTSCRHQSSRYRTPHRNTYQHRTRLQQTTRHLPISQHHTSPPLTLPTRPFRPPQENQFPSRHLSALCHNNNSNHHHGQAMQRVCRNTSQPNLHTKLIRPLSIQPSINHHQRPLITTSPCSRPIPLSLNRSTSLILPHTNQFHLFLHPTPTQHRNLHHISNPPRFNHHLFLI